MPCSPSGSRLAANRSPASFITWTSWWASAHSSPTKIIVSCPPLIAGLLPGAESTRRDLMDQCSKHDTPSALWAALTDQPGHDLTLGIEFQATTVLTGRRLGTSLACSRVEVVDPH